MSPSISPGKTWSGFAGGLATVIVLSIVVHGTSVTPLLVWATLIVATVAYNFSPVFFTSVARAAR